MKIASGILFLTKSNQALFLKRGVGGDHPGEWCFPGGTQEPGESIVECAERETKEEIGFLPEGSHVEWTRQIAPTNVVVNEEQVDFTTLIQRIDEQFVPTVSGEHTGYAWADVATPPEPLHPGARIALARLSMDELGVARSIASGELTSPQRYKNLWFFAIRITGTGAAVRREKKDPATGKLLRPEEFVWRKPENYLNDDFLARCNGLSVIYGHPDNATLDSEEFANRVIGSIMLPYIKGDDVFGVAKIYDDAAAELMREKQLSTSPTVVLGNLEDPDVRVKSEDGKIILIEGKPELLDHVAICELGVWDKGGDPTGVVNQTLGDSERMTPEEMEADAKRKDAEEKEKADRAKADAEKGEVLEKLADAVAKCADGISRMDKRMDAVEAKADAASAKADAAAKKDADEDDDKRKDGESEDEWKVRTDKKRKDAEEKAEKEKADAEAKEAEEKEKADKAKADAAGLDEIRTKVNELSLRIKPRTPEDKAKFADAQARADSAYIMLGKQAPPPMDGEGLSDYRRRLASPLKVHSQTWKDVSLDAIADDVAFTPIEGQIYADAITYAKRPLAEGPSMLREITRTLNGHTINEFVGSTDAWMNNFSGNRQRATGDWKKNLGGSR